MAMKCPNLAARMVLSAMECMDRMGDTGSSPSIPPGEWLRLWDSPSSIEDEKLVPVPPIDGEVCKSPIPLKPLPVPPPESESHAERMPVTPPELLNGDYIDLSTPTEHAPFHTAIGSGAMALG